MTGPPMKRKSNSEDELPKPPDGGWGWVVVFASFMIHVIADGITYTFGIFLVELISYYGEGRAATSWIPSILVGVTLGTGPISSAFVNKYGCRPVTIVGAVLASIGLAVSIFAPNVSTLYITIGLITGLGFGFIYLPAIVSVTCYFDQRRAFATGIAVCGSGLGTFIFAPLNERLIGEFQWKGAMLIISGIVLNCVFFGALFRPLKSSKSKNDSVEDGTVESKQLLLPSDPSTPVIITTLPNNDPLRKNVSAINLETNQPNGNVGDITRNFSTGTFTTAPVPWQANGQTLPPNVPVTNITTGGNRTVKLMTCSQPVLGRNNSTRPKVKFGSQGHITEEPYKTGKRTQSQLGLMHRKDIFYPGSVANIGVQRGSLAQRGSFATSHLETIYRKAHTTESETDSDESTVTVCGCIPCSSELHYAIKEMMDFSIFRDWVYILFVTSNFLTSIGFNVPYVYIVDRAVEMGIDSESASFLLAIMGIANTIGRIILGFISDMKCVNRLYVYNAALMIAGLSTALSVFCFDYVSYIIYSIVFGASIGAYVGLTSVILVDLLGLDKLTNAFGILLLFQGVASLIGPPIAGILYDSLNSYDPGFIVAGITITASGFILFFVPCLLRLQVIRDNKLEVEMNIIKAAKTNGFNNSVNPFEHDDSDDEGNALQFNTKK